MIISTIINKKEQPINLRKEYFHWSDTFYNYNKKNEHAINLRYKYFKLDDTFYRNKQKERSNKFALEIFSLL